MAYRLTTTVRCGIGNDGKALAADLYDFQGGDPITLTETFVDIGNGDYAVDWQVPNGFRGYVLVYDTGTSDVLSSLTIAPEDVELVGQGGGQQSDPWNVVLPGGYEQGRAGHILGHLAGATQVAFSAPVININGDVTGLVKGNDYTGSQAIPFDETEVQPWPVLGNNHVWIEAFGQEIDMVVAKNTVPQKVVLDLQDTVTKSIVGRRFLYKIFVQLADGDTKVLGSGRLIFGG